MKESSVCQRDVSKSGLAAREREGQPQNGSISSPYRSFIISRMIIKMTSMMVWRTVNPEDAILALNVAA